MMFRRPSLNMEVHLVPLRENTEGKVRGKGREEVNVVKNKENETL